MKKALIAEKRATAAAVERRETLIDVEKERQLKLSQPDAPAGNLLVVNDLALERGNRLFAHLSFTVAAGDRVAVVGPNGSGKTSLLDQIEQPRRHRQSGTLARPAHVSVARAFQHPLWASGSLRQKLRDAGFDEGRFRQVMAVLGVRGSVLDNPIEDLSQGQRKKIDLARTFLAKAHLLLWDEPLNFVDIDTRELLEEVLLRDAPTVVFVEHDAVFVARVATQVVELAPG